MDSLSVSQFLAAYNASLVNALELQALAVTGTLEARSDRLYGGELYWSLVDHGGAHLTVRIPERYRHLKGRRVQVTGQPHRQLRKNRGEIELTLHAERVTPLDPTPDDWMGLLRPIGEKRRSSWQAIERSLERQILAGEKPRVLMLLSTSSIVEKDVLAALGQHREAYTIEARRIPLTNPAAVSAALSAEKVDAHLIAMVRGGGEDISALSDRQVLEAVAHHVPIPIVSAVGHEVDQPLIQDLVHWAFPTPTALGTWLAERATGALHARDAAASDHRREREALERQLKDLSDEAGALRRRVRRMNALLFALSLLAFILLARWVL